MLAFDSDLAPIVGQQVTLDDTNLSDVSSRIDLLEQRAAASFTSAILGGLTTECDLVAKGRWNNRVRSALYDPGTGTYTLDSQGDSAVTSAEMRTMAQAPGQATTYTCVPPGSGVRIGLDRDGDGIWNYDEALSSTQAHNPGSVPGACSDGIDNDGDGQIDMADAGCAHASANIENPECSDGYNNDGDGLSDLADPHCSDPSANRELAPAGGDDCRVGPGSPVDSAVWLALIALGILASSRRRRV
jgi:MYXO-CTERM domain-containing protein